MAVTHMIKSIHHNLGENNWRTTFVRWAQLKFNFATKNYHTQTFPEKNQQATFLLFPAESNSKLGWIQFYRK